MHRVVSLACGLLVPGLLAGSAMAQDSPAGAETAAAGKTLAEQDALRIALAGSPGLRAALVDIQRARASVSAEDDRYPLTLQLDASADHIRSPSLATDLDGQPITQTATNDSVTLGSELQQSLPWGTSFAFRLQGRWFRRTFPTFIPNPTGDGVVPFTATFGPGYSLSARFSVVQPLLRGFGKDVGEAELRAAQLDEEVTQRTSDRAASELLRDVLSAYWELWYGREAEDIERQSRDLAEAERQQAEARIEEGASAPADVHTFASQVAERDELVLAARFDKQRRALALGLLLGQPGTKSRGFTTTGDAPPALEGLPRVEQLVERAQAASPELRELDAQVKAAHDRERVVGEPDRQRLDLEGWVQTEGLGNQAVPPAFDQFGTFGAFSAHVGLVYELPLTGSRYASQKAAARHASDVLETRREALRQRIESDVRQLHQNARSARERVALAKRTSKLAKARLAAAKDRYNLGGGLAIDVERADDTLRRAKLRRARAAVDVALARFGLEHLTGQLLTRHADTVADLEAGIAGGQAPIAPRGPF